MRWHRDFRACRTHHQRRRQHIALNVLGGWAGEALGSIPSLRTFRRKDEPNHDLLDAMDRRGLHLSLEDRRALEALKDRLGITAAGEAG